MKMIIYIPLFALFYSITYSQTIFQKRYGGNNDDNGYAIQITADGGYIIAGLTTSFGAENDDIYLIKLDPNGNIIWSKTYGDSLYDDAYDVKQTTDGGYIIAGYTESVGAQNGDAFIIKTDANGNILWVRTFGGTNSEGALSVMQIANGDCVITGWSDGDVYLIKVDASGNIIWMKTFGTTAEEYGETIMQSADGGYVISGVNESSGGGDVLLMKTDANGNFLWAKSYGGSLYDDGYHAQQTADGGFIITGATASFGAGSSGGDCGDVYLIKTDSNGNLLWSKTYGGTACEDGNSVQQTSAGGYIIACKTQSFGAGDYEAYLIKTDVNGSMLWSKTYGTANNEFTSSIQQNPDEGYVIVGSAVDSIGKEYIYLIRTDSNGNSGCNETVPNTLSANAATVVANLSMQVSSVAGTSNPNVFTGSGGIANIICSNLGTDDIYQYHIIHIHPNPSTGELTIENNSDANVTQINIFNSLGQKVHEMSVNKKAQTIKMNISMLPAGIYNLQIVTDKGMVTKQVAVEKK